MQKLLCSDYDGTLRINQLIAKFDLEAINKFGIVTGFLKDSTLSKTIELYDELSLRYKNKLAFHFNNGTIDVSALSVSKKNAIKQLSLMHDIADVYAIGDGYNDLEMIREFAGFTVANAPNGVKQHALKIFSSVCECINFIIPLKI